MNCQSKSAPCSLGARLSAVLWGFLFGFVVLFRSKLFNIISFPFNEPGWKHFFVNITEVFYCSGSGDYKTTTFWLTNAINVMKIPLCFTFHCITRLYNTLNTSVWRTAFHKGKMYFPWCFLELLWETVIPACFFLPAYLSLHFLVFGKRHVFLFSCRPLKYNFSVCLSVLWGERLLSRGHGFPDAGDLAEAQGRSSQVPAGVCRCVSTNLAFCILVLSVCGI